MKRIHVLIAVRLELKESINAAASGIRSFEEGKSEGARSHSTTARVANNAEILRPLKTGNGPATASSLTA